MIDIKLPKDCFCFSLRTACLIIGYSIAALSLLIYTETIVHVILMEDKKVNSHAEWPDITYHVFKEMLFEYGSSSQFVCSLYLLYGIYKEKSYFTLTWLVCEFSCAISFIIDFLFTPALQSPGALEYITCFTLLFIAMVTVLSYYLDQPRQANS